MPGNYKTTEKILMTTASNECCQLSKDVLEDYVELGYGFQSNLVQTLGTGNSYYLFDITGVASSTKIIILPVILVADDGPVVINFRVGHDYTGGTALRLINRNGNSSNTPDIVVTSGPTGTSTGIVNTANLIGQAGNPTFSGGGAGGGVDAFVAPAGITFLIEVNNQAAGSIQLEYNLRWFEIPDGV